MKTRPSHSRVISFSAYIRKLPILTLLCLLTATPLLAGCQPKAASLTIAEAGEGAQIFQEGKDPFQAQAGQVFQIGDKLLAPQGEAVKLELDDGSVVRLSGGSVIQLLALGQEGQAARFQLLSGSAWIILEGDEIEVQTYSGNAIVRGSYMSVSTEAVGFTTNVTCLEGHCELSNAQGSTVMSAGQTAAVSSPQEAPAAAQEMDTDQYTAWADASPEAVSVVGDRGGTVSSETTQNWWGPVTHINIVYDLSCEDFQRSLPNSACFPVRFENNCHGGEDGKIGMWNWYFVSEPLQLYPGWSIFSWDFELSVVPGGSFTAVLPAFTYDVWAWSSSDPSNRTHWVNQTFTSSSSINVRMCPDEPALPTEPLTEPLRYELENNCPAGSSDPNASTVWHWKFEQFRGVTIDAPIWQRPIEFTLAPGESASGELEPGIWIERDWTENGSVDNPSSMRIGGFDQVRLCPDDPPLNQP